ncbi:MAG: hypothetical protein H6685_13445 [Deltaproteobacteria bacterium]|nr:hypothetical protein [Deltaproteobacteria bacterium]
MRSTWFFTAVLLVGLLGSMLFVVGACGDDDDDDDDDDDASDFDDLDDDDDDSDDDTSDDIGTPDGSGDPQAGDPCSCSGCEGCDEEDAALVYELIQEDADSDAGIDEIASTLDLGLSGLDVDPATGACLEESLDDAVSCMDDGLNCLFECDGESCYNSCATQAASCLSKRSTALTSCLSDEGSPCAAFASCALSCDGEACYDECAAASPECAEVAAPLTRLGCLTDLSDGLSGIADSGDAVQAWSSYAACLR